jgi:hypothetical protein
MQNFTLQERVNLLLRKILNNGIKLKAFTCDRGIVN